MDLQRQEYPALLRSLSPNQAVAVCEDRVRLIGKINLDIADWLSERRRVEEVYVQGLKKLATRRPHEASADLGIFQSPWQSILSSIESIAASHNVLAQKIETDVERPLKEYQNKNREMQAINQIQGNLAVIAREVESAGKKASKLNTGKSSASKIANATSDVEAANQQWESQAPYVFEQLQALDESRVNHLRDVLTQLETHEVDQVERNRAAAESCLNVLLNVDTSDEISTFVARQTTGTSPIPEAATSDRRESRSATSGTTPVVPPEPPAATPPRASFRDNSMSDRPSPFSSSSKTGSGPPPAKSSFAGLRRLGTVLGRQSKGARGMERPPSPEKRSRTGRNPLRRGPSSRQEMQILESPPQSSSSNMPSTLPHRDPPLVQTKSTEPPEQPQIHHEDRGLDDNMNGNTVQPVPNRVSSMPMTNGNQPNRELATVQETGNPPMAPSSEVTHDAEGYSVPPPAVDDITRAQQEAAAVSDAEQSQFKLNIRNEPIRDEDRDAQSAFSSVANTLRAQAQQVTAPRKPSSNRGRRDVRNTIFVPSGQSLETAGIGGSPPIAPHPFNSGSSPSLPSDAQRGSDAQSVRSNHSMSSSVANTTIIHPQMHHPGLNASIVETVSATLSQNQVIKAVVIGEVALQHNATETASASGSENIRLENFPVLEKVAPNPTFITQRPSTSGEYAVNLSQVARPTVAFKYQVHLDESSLGSHAPVSLTPSWKIEPTQASVILSYAFNSAFVSPATRSVSLKNVVVFISVDKAKAQHCQSKPAGIFAKDKSTIYWKLGDITLDGYATAPQKLLARFSTDSEAKAGSVEVRWEISGEHATGLGSGLSVSQLHSTKDEGGSDPFADESTTAASWKELPVTRRIISGKYVAQ